MRLLVTGREGQVARALAERAAAQGVTVVPLARPELDLGHPETILPALRRAGGDIVVNAAAYTAVDRAESEPDLAHAVNATGAGAVAAAAAHLRIPVVQISTDYVFDGTCERPYRESDPVGPVGAYGRSKLAGEAAVAAATPDHVILRTAWVYAPFGQNFVRTMLRLAESREEVGVVADQQGTPTSALDIADGVIAVCRNLLARPDDQELRGVFHLTGAGHATWADLAEAVFATSARLGGPAARVRRIRSEEYPTPARRPANSRLDGSRLQRVHGVVLPDWRASVRSCVGRLLAARRTHPEPQNP
jgi:dTDP-4-dehydrorhamnose reductase